MSDTLEVLDQGQRIVISFQEMLKYHGPAFPGGVAHAFKVMERAFPLLDPDLPPERREIAIETAFRGPGARDACEMVTRAVTGDRYVVDAALERPQRGTTLERYVFRLRYRDRAVTVTIRDGFVLDEFIALARREGRSAEEEAHLAVLKQEMADRLMAAPATEVYDVDGEA
ncbi:MAG: hypothetical protein MSC31_01820 [Solirubrobacteraceae bacterium MAG38_C4-C5]|nr:hypothetical protein [Candidatus Siliceabacter maunaloa]